MIQVIKRELKLMEMKPLDFRRMVEDVVPEVLDSLRRQKIDKVVTSAVQAKSSSVLRNSQARASLNHDVVAWTLDIWEDGWVESGECLKDVLLSRKPEFIFLVIAAADKRRVKPRRPI